MRRTTLMILLGFGLLAVAVFAVDGWDNMRAMRIDLYNANGQSVGIVTLYPVRPHTILVTGSVRGLTAGFHGFHIHEHGLCEVTSEGVFMTAGGHLDLRGKHHGEHTGDMPTLLADEQGNATISFNTTQFELSDLTDNDGTAIIIHAGADNFANIPERYGGPDATTLANGDSGARIACGVIRKS